MNWDAVGALAELMGAVGVIVTLIYLSRQVRDNTESIRRSTAHDALLSIARFNEFVASDPQLVDLFWRGTGEPDSLTEDEWHRFVSLASTLIRRFELLYLDHLGGALSDEIWTAQVQNIRTWMSSAGAKRWFDSLGAHVHVGFRELVTELPSGAP
ncbi:MAG: hypothetical protein ACR2QM_15625 [Longimicrobiales bacterium]